MSRTRHAGAPPIWRTAGPSSARTDRLKTDGTYDRILKKWGTTESAIEKSEIPPPEIK